MLTLKFKLAYASLLVGCISVSQGIPVGGPCSRNEDCDDYKRSTICDPVISVCLCNDRHVLVNGPDRITCEPIRMEIGETCKVRDQCTLGIPGELSDCLPSYTDPYQNVCNCTEEAVNAPGEHVCIRKNNFIGEPCEVDIQCKANLGDLSSCVSQICTCSDEAVVNKNGTFCLQIVNLIGGECEESQQCILGTPGPHSDCVESLDDPNIKTCNCTGGAKPEPGNHQCLKSVGNIGEACELDGDCKGKPGISSACSNSGICSCLGGYLPSSQLDDCVKKRNGLGESCIESRQCQQGIPGILSACTLGSCKCTGYSVNEPGQDFCYRKATLVGDPCQIHEQCWGNLEEKSYCIGGKCECTRDSQPSFDLSKCV